MSTSITALAKRRHTLPAHVVADRVVQSLLDAEKALSVAVGIDQVKLVMNVAAAQEVFAQRQNLGEVVIGFAFTIKSRALAKLGDLLVSMPKQAGARGRLGGGSRASKKDVQVNAPPTLAEILGMKPMEAQKLAGIAQRHAALPAKDQEAIAQRETTSAAVRRTSKEQQREARRQSNRAKVAEASTGTLAVGLTFATIVIDPPWDWNDEGDSDQLGRARPTYATLTLDQIRDFKVDGVPLGERADKDCHLYLWITNRSLPKGFALLEHWGFRYVTCLTWCKPSIGMGNYFRGSTEQVLFGVKGSQPLKRKDVGTWFAAPRQGEHSTKPDAFYELVKSCSPGPILEVFGRKARAEFTVVGADA